MSAFVLMFALNVALAQDHLVRVVAAADLQFALAEIVELFKAEHPDLEVELNFGSSGRFYTQIAQGLPADIYFSADEQYPLLLEEQGLTVPGSRQLYAVGRMVLWVSDDLLNQGLDVERGLEVLRDPRVRQLAVANPVHAPYGRAGVSMLEYYGLLEKTQDVAWEDMEGGIPAYYNDAALREGKASFEFIYGENIAQTAQLALTSTDVGIIALSIARAQAMQEAGDYWLSPLESHLELKQNYVILKGQDRPAVRAFHDFIVTPQAHDIMRYYGFLLPGETLE